jgi:hypothetical protein
LTLRFESVKFVLILRVSFAAAVAIYLSSETCEDLFFLLGQILERAVEVEDSNVRVVLRQEA